MQHIREEIRIEAPVEHVWKYYCDTSNWKDFYPRAEFSDFSGQVDEVGTTYVQSMKLMGFEMSQDVEIVEVEPLRLIHEHSDSGPMDNTIRLEPNGDATRCVFESDWDMPGKDGIWLLSEVKRLSPRTRRVLFSGSQPTELGDHLASGLVECFISKPSSRDEIVSSLER